MSGVIFKTFNSLFTKLFNILNNILNCTGYIDTKNYSLFIWNSRLTGRLVFYLAVLPRSEKRREVLLFDQGLTLSSVEVLFSRIPICPKKDYQRSLAPNTWHRGEKYYLRNDCQPACPTGCQVLCPQEISIYRGWNQGLWQERMWMTKRMLPGVWAERSGKASRMRQHLT